MINTKHDEIINALTDAQKLIFAPMAFQATAALIEFGIIEYLDKKEAKESDIMSELNLDEYTVRTLIQIGILNNLIKENNSLYTLTKMGELFLYDDMTKANFNFIKDVCYLGASELTESFRQRKPAGLNKFFSKSETIYPIVPKLPDKMRQSWYEFDHLYSDNCFDVVFKIISEKYSSIFDIGGNTGKFELVCLKNDKNFDITILDLEENIKNIKNNPNLNACKSYAIDVLSNEPKYPKMNNCGILMSQFLDCFSKESIVKILTDICKSMDNDSSVYILEPFTDKQQFNGAEYSLVHTSLYFTCMANGVSKMYTSDEMVSLVNSSGLSVKNCFDNIGPFDYTLLECKKDAMVSN